MDARMKIGWITGQQLMAYLERELELVFSKDPWKLNGGWGVRASGMTMVFKASAEPGRRLVYSWGDGTESDSGLKTVVTWSLTPEGAGTRVRMEQSGFRPEDERGYKGMGGGWPRILERLEGSGTGNGGG